MVRIDKQDEIEAFMKKVCALHNEFNEVVFAMMNDGAMSEKDLENASKVRNNLWDAFAPLMEMKYNRE